MKKQVELSITHNGKDVVAYPYSKKEHVQFENGMNIDEFVGQDIATPTITHDTTAIKVGVGDSDVSGSVVDGTVNMTIKGQTYQNILPEPTLRNEMQGKSMQRLNEGYDSIETVDGVSKSAILKGNTLVNVDSYYSKDDFVDRHILNLTDDGWIELVANGNYRNAFTRFNGMIKPNTKYLAVVEVKENTLVNETLPERPFYLFTNFSNSDGEVVVPFVDQTRWISQGQKGLFKYILTSRGDLSTTTINLRNFVSNTTTSGRIIYRTMLIEYVEGMENWDIPFFRGIQYVKMPVLTTTGKNLCDGVREYNGVNDVYGANFIKVEEGKRYGIYQEDKNFLRIDGYSNNKEFVTSITGGNVGLITIPSGVKYIKWKYPLYGEPYNENSKIMIALSDRKLTLSDYEPHKSNILTVNEDVTLRSDGNICDELNLLTGQLTQRIGEDGVVLSQEVVKTVDLSSSGNWEKIVLNGSENWSMASESSNNNAFFRGGNTVPNNVKVNSNNLAQKVICDILTPFTQEQICNKPNDIYGISLGWNDSNLCVRHKDFPLTNEGLTQWKQYLQQNPITVWYQTTTTQDNSIREMLSFANGHLQVSSEAENSLLPSVQYEIPTKNSYHMDLMKANTTYTMKLASGNGSINKWDGEAIGFMLSRTFNSGTLPKDNLFYTTGWVNDLMILEGDLNAKTIPYFKGIKSAFEGEDKIEVLSTGKNLFDRKLSEYDYIGNYDKNEVIIGDNFIEWNASNTYKGAAYYHLYVKPNTGYTLSLERNIMQRNCITIYDGFVTSNVNSIGDMGINKNNTSFVTLSNKITIRFSNGTILNETFKIYNVQLEEGDTVTTYEPYKSNSTKIPLLSPLRSLPNGVCDELIINRMKKKATLIQRIKTVTLDGSSDERWTGYNDDSARVTQGFYHNVSDLVIARANVNLYCDTLQPNINAIHSRDGRGVGTHNDGSNNRNIRLCLLKNELIPYGFSEPLKTNENVLRKWLQDNPTTVCYELATPVVTEVDLEGFPYIYKDGHIFLNSDIAPTTQITYSINQAQQIESANENLQRHEKEISHLQKLIAQYIQVEYESTLLSLKI